MGNGRSCEAGVSQLVQLHPEPGGEEGALVASELRRQGPAMGVSGFKVVKNSCEQGSNSKVGPAGIHSSHLK